ncbi:MAG: SPOR domain-containing protein [Marinobacter psychrophilus]|jgi:DedD protein|nr:SPOR domain-containing protein [Marinobacter psychrophilus]MBQ0763980.1 SPOR domain-containing protein [Marinobacter psychrophilus]MBQ0844646.1 SPOR domain-containing protein [Marinobacter psychrophilus]
MIVDGLKQRIIGALVLISLAVIFVPMIFDEPHSGRNSTSINIPEEPPFPEVSTEPPPQTAMPEYQNVSEPAAADRASGSGDFKLIEEVTPEPPEPTMPTAASNTVTPPPVAEVKPALARPEPNPQTEEEFSRSLEGAWVVQLGSFSDADNARRLRDSAREKGYSSHLQEFSRGDTRLTRVFSGPFASKSESEAAKAALDKAFSLNSLVTSPD